MDSLFNLGMCPPRFGSRSLLCSQNHLASWRNCRFACALLPCDQTKPLESARHNREEGRSCNRLKVSVRLGASSIVWNGEGWKGRFQHSVGSLYLTTRPRGQACAAPFACPATSRSGIGSNKYFRLAHVSPPSASPARQGIQTRAPVHATNSRRTAGFFLAMLSSRSAALCGRRMPCSQLLTHATLVPR